MASVPAGRSRPLAGSIAETRPTALPVAAPRPPITYAIPFSVAAAACVVGAGSSEIASSVRRAGSKASTTRLAVPFGVDPPAITSLPPAAVTAA